MKRFHIDNFFPEPKKIGDISVYQIGTLHSDDAPVSDTHMHGNFFELTAIIDGEAEISANDVPLHVKKNEIFVSFPFETHKIVNSSVLPLKYYFFAFDTGNETYRYQLDKITRDFALIRNRKIRSERIFDALAQAVYEVTGNDVFHDELCVALLNTVIIMTIRECVSHAGSLRVPDKNEVFAYSVMNYINTHIHSIRSLTELCDVFNYEYSHISKTFSKTTGQSLLSYYRFRRLETARVYLYDGRTVTETADALNYASVYSFSLAFKKQYGMSPLKYARFAKTKCI